MKNHLNHELMEQLFQQGKSYKEISKITGYNINSVSGWGLRSHGKLIDRNKSRRQSIPITDEQNEYLFGTLMGDGNLQLFNKNNNSVLGRTNHSIKQYTYCLYKQKVLSPLTYPVKLRTITLNGKEYNQCYFCFKPNTDLLNMYYLFYKNGKKDIPEDLSLLTPKAMAWWFMDDGTSSGKCSISIATCSFSLDGLLRLKKFLKDRYDIDVTIQKDFKIYFHADSAIKFYNLIKEYIIDDMLYKFKYIKTADLKLR